MDKSQDTEARWLKEVPAIRQLINTGKNREALDIYNRMSDKIKNIRMFQIIHIEICSGLTDEEYDKAIKDYEKLYPNEPNMHLLQIDEYTVRKDYPKALNAVNELDKMIDKDPLLDYHRAMCYTLMKDTARRVECLERLVKNMPDFEDGIIELIASYFSTKEFEKAKPLVDNFKSKAEFNQLTLKLLLNSYPGYDKKYGSN
jgi:tetratricopeptide (TPR) repeat protein